MNATHTTPEMRDAFEAWDCQEFCIDVEHYKQVNGVYVDAPIRNRWLTWQAAQSQPAPPVPSSVQEIMRLIQPYVAACLKFNYTPMELIEEAEADVNAAFKPIEAALTALVDDNHRLRFELDGVNAMRRPMEWIDVDERLPEGGEMVLVCVRNGVGSSDPESNHFEAEEVREIDFGDFNEPGGYMQCYGGPHGAFADDITHWMPLPTPPTHGIAPEHGENHG